MYTQKMGWFADHAQDRPGMWALWFQAPGMVCRIADLWFDSEDEALAFARSYIVGVGLWPDIQAR